MKTYTVKQLARLAGVSVRTLHHYDRIGLLKPAHIGKNSYRYYTRVELLRLQEIMFHRELDISLAQIEPLLEVADDERAKILVRYRGDLAEKSRRFAQLLQTIDRTIANLKGDRAMTDADLYMGFSPEKQAEYEQWLITHYGGEMNHRVTRSSAAFSKLSSDERKAKMAELADLEEALAGAMQRGTQAGSPSLDAVLDRHRVWVAFMWAKPCPPEAYAGLADLYLGHPDFVSRYESIRVGFADFLAASMKAYAKRVGQD